MPWSSYAHKGRIICWERNYSKGTIGWVGLGVVGLKSVYTYIMYSLIQGVMKAGDRLICQSYLSIEGRQSKNKGLLLSSELSGSPS